MSDGNFNRALLPSTPYASGVKMGRQQMKAKALQALVTTLQQSLPELTEEERKRILACFEREVG